MHPCEGSHDFLGPLKLFVDYLVARVPLNDQSMDVHMVRLRSLAGSR